MSVYVEGYSIGLNSVFDYVPSYGIDFTDCTSLSQTSVEKMLRSISRCEK